MSVSPPTKEYSEKYGKRLIGKTDMEDALKLDQLTQEEARMTIAETLRATHAVDKRVRRVTEQVLSVNNRARRLCLCVCFCGGARGPEYSSGSTPI